ncbi:uncharacterized protein N7469_009864 [Penicillium citrinum]|uniref:Uncharacterized protein n=2 Tax=Penicillium TaxID=5073 RepID=A0A9W9NJ71_PENCI|nr:uncharacterized protein N7469_009864 [Penicillium citrinum]KAJ5220977.1 hypothetical protein N7469_009864 [Penicillium citrinum]KAJ5595945.1 hypothetical protein N7450_002403 [Penicillium hetheringtonii]KAK5798428.1 hypothetical protein VI817_004718 [Penicillium citrinum]
MGSSSKKQHSGKESQQGKGKGKEAEGLGIMNVEVPTQTKKPEGMAKLCTCDFVCQHKKFARDTANTGKKVERPDVFAVLRSAEKRKGKQDQQNQE